MTLTIIVTPDIDKLIADLRSPDHHTTIQAAGALGRLGDPRALPYLKLIPQDDIHQAFFGSVSAAMGQQAERLRGKLTARELR